MLYILMDIYTVCVRVCECVYLSQNLMRQNSQYTTSNERFEAHKKEPGMYDYEEENKSV